MNLTAVRRALSAPMLAFGVSILIASVALVVAGHSPFTGFRAMYDNIATADGIVTVVNFASRYYVMGAAVALGFKMNLFNIGANGQYQVAALLAGALGGWLGVPGPLLIVLMILVAMAAGSAWALVPGVLNVSRNVNIVVATIMMNGVASGVIGYLLRTKFRDKADIMTAHTKTIPADARMPHLNRLLRVVGIDLPSTTFLHGFLFVAVGSDSGLMVRAADALARQFRG